MLTLERRALCLFGVLVAFIVLMIVFLPGCGRNIRTTDGDRVRQCVTDSDCAINFGGDGGPDTEQLQAEYDLDVIEGKQE
jgi:hypothetical protein